MLSCLSPCFSRENREDIDVFHDALENAFELDAQDSQFAGFESDLGGQRPLVVEYITEANNNSGWSLAHASEPLEVSYRHERGSGIHSIKLRFDLDFPIDRVFAMGWEFELLDTWNPYAIDPTIVDRESDEEMAVYCAIWLPWPFSPRELCVQIKTADRLHDHGCYFVRIHDAEHENEVPKKSAGKGKRRRERASIVKGSCALVYPAFSRKEGGELRPKTKVLICCHCNPLVLAPPNWLVNFILRLMAPTIFRHLVKALRNAYGALDDSPRESPYAERVHTKKMYAKMRDRVEEVFVIQSSSSTL